MYGLESNYEDPGGTERSCYGWLDRNETTNRYRNGRQSQTSRVVSMSRSPEESFVGVVYQSRLSESPMREVIGRGGGRWQAEGEMGLTHR